MITIFDMILYLLFFVQGVLLGIWTVARDKPTPWRFVGVVVAITALVCLQKVPGFDFLGQVEQLAVPLLFIVVFTSLTLFVARAAGVRITRVSRRASSNWGRIKMIRRKGGLKETDSASAEPPKLQFSLWSLMSWTTAFAVLLSSLSTLYIIMPRTATGGGALLKIAVGFMVFSPILLAALWIALADRWMEARIVMLGLAIPTTTLILSLLVTRGRSSFDSEALEFVCVMTALLIGSFLILRLTGHRLVWRKSAAWSLFRGTRRRI
jgi:hypothetical protein